MQALLHPGDHHGLFPIVYVFGLALDPRSLARPDGLNLIPADPSLRGAFGRAIANPSA